MMLRLLRNCWLMILQCLTLINVNDTLTVKYSNYKSSHLSLCVHLYIPRAMCLLHSVWWLWYFLFLWVWANFIFLNIDCGLSSLVQSLTAVKFSSSSLTSLSLAGCRYIMSLELTCPYLEQVSLDGCDHLERAAFSPVSELIIISYILFYFLFNLPTHD